MVTLSKRVVVTGMDLISPLGVGIKQNWQNLLDGKSGIVSLEGEAFTKGIPNCIGGRLPKEFDLDKYKIKHFDNKVFNLANALSDLVVQDAQIDFRHLDRDRIGVSLGNYASIMNEISEGNKKGYKAQIHMVPCMVASKYNLQGYISAASSACATATIAIGNAFREINNGYQDVVIAGGVDLTMNRFMFQGTRDANIANINASFAPSEASRPFDKSRAGTVGGEGGGMLILESLEHALKRKAPKIYCEIVGYHQNTDAAHLTTARQGSLFKAQKYAMIEAGITPNMIDFMNAHATGTVVGDEAEAQSIKALFGNERLSSSLKELIESNYEDVVALKDYNESLMRRGAITSSFKGNIGHTGHACGGVETVMGIKAMQENMIPKLLNLNEPCVDLNFPFENTKKEINIMMKQGIGIGIVNAVIILRKFNT